MTDSQHGRGPSRRALLLGAGTGAGLAAIAGLWYGRPWIAGAEAARIDWDQPQVDAPGPLAIRVYRGEGCGCCTLWLEHLERHGFSIDDHLLSVADLNRRRQELGVPDHLASCHTGIIDGYLIEGHVPADDIKRLLIDRPEGLGISVPGMPVGTPGMEIGDRRDPFTVVLFSADGERAFRSYRDY